MRGKANPGAEQGLLSRPCYIQLATTAANKSRSLHYVASSSYYRVYVTFSLACCLFYPHRTLSLSLSLWLRQRVISLGSYKLFWDLVARFSCLSCLYPSPTPTPCQSPDSTHSSGSLLSSVSFVSVLCLMTSFCMKNCSCIQSGKCEEG